MMTDPIADMLTRIRNGMAARHDTVRIPASRTKTDIARILRDEGYVSRSVPVDSTPAEIEVFLKYHEDGRPVISGIERVSRPGRRVYRGKNDMPKILNGLGIAIVSTSRGLLTDRQCREQGVGGEVLCKVW
jgi:small subunit ribosomal protein S8